MNVFDKIEDTVDSTKKTSFKTRKRYFRKSLNGNNTKSVTIDDFGNPWRFLDIGDKTKIISITLPESLINILDKKRAAIPRSRYLREIIEFALDLERTDVKL